MSTDKDKARYARFREAHRDELRAKARERSRRNYAENRDEVLEESKRWRENNREKSRSMSRDWRERNPERARNLHLKRYGLTVEQWNFIFEFQGRRCAVCRSDDPKSKKGWHTDHDHVTGIVRGILCHPCNVSLGHLGDSAESVSTRCSQFTNYLTPDNLGSLPANAGLLLCL